MRRTLAAYGLLWEGVLGGIQHVQSVRADPMDTMHPVQSLGVTPQYRSTDEIRRKYDRADAAHCGLACSCFLLPEIGHSQRNLSWDCNLCLHN